jgi:hypothetical protein
LRVKQSALNQAEIVGAIVTRRTRQANGSIEPSCYLWFKTLSAIVALAASLFMLEINGPINLAEAIQAAASVVGLGTIIWQINHLIRNIQGTTQDNIYRHYRGLHAIAQSA